MNDSNSEFDAKVALPWYKQQLSYFIGGSLIIAAIIVVVSLVLYNTSGTAQLDLSRPGYKSVVGNVETVSFDKFPDSGPVTSDTLNKFLETFDKQVQPVLNQSVFNPDSLEYESLGIGE